jgi:hypothetical protein
MNIKDSTVLLTASEVNEHSMEIDKIAGSSSIRAIAIQTEVKKMVEGLSEKVFQVQNGETSLHQSLSEKFGLEELDKLDYGFKDSKNYSRKTQTWQGFIIEINDTTFIAKLEDLSNPGGTHEIAEFNLDEVSPGDVSLIQKGSIFYWSVGSVMANGQLKKESILRFKRVAPWTEEEYDKAADLADTLSKSIHWE